MINKSSCILKELREKHQEWIDGEISSFEFCAEADKILNPKKQKGDLVE